MQILAIVRALGILLCCEAGLMVPSLVVALIYQDGDVTSFLISIGITLCVGLPLAVFPHRNKRPLFAREGFALVGLGWLLLSVFGALPYWISGVADSYVDALFESISGFTTTGATILRSVEGTPRGILFWRSFSNWVGGMGVLVLTIAILPQLGARNMEILRAESTGPSPGKLLPRLRDSAKALYGIYVGLSFLMIIALLLAGVSPYHAFVNAFATAGTGGFSVLNQSIGGYNSLAVEIITGVFMLLFGVNFALYFALITKDYRRAVHNEELWAYLAIVFIATVAVSLNVLPIYRHFGDALRHAFFQVASIITSSGYSTVDYGAWPTFSHVVLMFLMVVGACAGSTGGGMKIARLLLMVKGFGKDISLILHPRIVKPVTVDGKAVDEKTIRSVFIFFFVYVMICVFAMLVVSLEGHDFVTTFTAALAAVSNVGPGLGVIGPSGNFADFSALSKLTLGLCMLLGRLEIMPILLLLSPALWRKG